MSRRRRGPTPKAGSRRAAVADVRPLTEEQLRAVELAFLEDDQDDDDCAICRAAGIRVLDDGSVVER